MEKIPQCDDCGCTDFLYMYPVKLVLASTYFAELGKPKLSPLVNRIPEKCTAVCKGCLRHYDYEI